MKLNNRADVENKIIVWYKGDEYKFTGKVETLYGGLFATAEPTTTGAKKNVLIALNLT